MGVSKASFFLGVETIQGRMLLLPSGCTNSSRCIHIVLGEGGFDLTFLVGVKHSVGSGWYTNTSIVIRMDDST